MSYIGRITAPLHRVDRRGFTLIELMIVVAIIGILVSIAAPNFQKYQAKSRQAEAKLALASIFALEKSFYGEYSAYIPEFAAIGYTPEGLKRFYAVGWTGATYAGTISGFSAALGTKIYGTLNTPTSAFTCALSPATVDATAAPFDVNDPQTFWIGSAGNIRPGTVSANNQCDYWTIDNLKSLRNTQLGF